MDVDGAEDGAGGTHTEDSTDGEGDSVEFANDDTAATGEGDQRWRGRR